MLIYRKLGGFGGFVARPGELLLQPEVTLLMRILKLAKYRLKAQVEKDKAPEWRRMKAQVEKDEGPEAETLSRLSKLLSQIKFVTQFVIIILSFLLFYITLCV